MKRFPEEVLPYPGDWSRRRFVRGVAFGGAASAFGLLRPLCAQPVRPRVAELSGSEFDLDIGSTSVNFSGAPRAATVVNGSLPAPILR